MTTIAFCGLGMMGSAMAARLRSAGNDVRVWNRSQEKTTTWVAAGGTACDSPRMAARGASEGHLMLADDAAVETTLFDSNGLLAGLSKSATVIDHSTVGVAGARERARRVVSSGRQFLQAPIFGSPANVAQGQGLMLVGGDAQTYEGSRITLSQIVEKHFIVGDKPEEAAAFKLMGNCMLVSVVEGLAEFYAIAKATGIMPGRAFELFGSFDPCGTIARRGPRMAAGDYTPPAFDLSMALKDVRLMIEAAKDEDLVPALTMIEHKIRRLIAEGYAKFDLAALGIDAVAARGGEGR